jgi:hypothetical protein
MKYIGPLLQLKLIDNDGLEDTNTIRRKSTKNKNTKYLLPRNLEYKTPKIGVKPKWFNIKRQT